MVADVEVPEQLEVLAEVVAAEQDLDGAGVVLEIKEGGSAHVPECDDTASKGLAFGVSGGTGLGLHGLEDR